MGDVPHSQADNTRLKALFPDIEPVPFDDGLRNTVEWMRSEHAHK
jgi:UDP-glucose 4-epimerase